MTRIPPVRSCSSRVLVRLTTTAIRGGVALLCVAAGMPRVHAQGGGARPLSRADTLRGSNTPERAWWDVTFYDLSVRVNPSDSAIAGSNRIVYRVLQPSQTMQIDLQVPMVIDSIVQDGAVLTSRAEGNAYFVSLRASQTVGATKAITVYFHGKPKVARNAPWDGGFIWTKGPDGAAWVATANQGLGASVWWPTKDLQREEPDSQRVVITVPDPMIDVSNGRLRSTKRNGDGTTSYEWFVSSPINNYSISVNAGAYAHWADTLSGERGRLTLDYWPLASNLAAAKAQWAQVQPMMVCFENWFGPYPWYADGYKLLEAPHLGMEHQSAVAYGNGFRNGYRTRDLSGTGEGLKWDFIIIHESAHEWWGNNITASDVADNWIHEGFANYSEGIYAECQEGKESGSKYIIGSRRNIRNDRPIIGTYGVQREGSGDMYYKGGSMLHTIRQIVNDDAKWRGILRGLNATFGRKTVSTADVEAYISREAGGDLSKVFDQYLRTAQIPLLEYRVNGTSLSYRWSGVVPGFNMPVRVSAPGGASLLLRPTEGWQSVQSPLRLATDQLVLDESFYVTIKRVDAEE